MIQSIKIFAPILLASLLLFSSCSVNKDVASNGLFQKRKYNKGWYTSKSKAPKEATQATRTKLNTSRPSVVAKTGESTKAHIATREKQIKPTLVPAPSLRNDELPSVKDCDVIMMQDGTEVEVNVIEITPDHVKYRLCGDTDGALFTKSKSKVFMIKHANGKKTMIESDASEYDYVSPTPTKKERAKTMSSVSIFGMVFGLISPFLWVIGAFIHPVFSIISAIFFALIGLIASIVGMKETTDPNKHQGGLGFAVAGLSISIVMLIFFVFASLIVLAFLF